MAVVSSPRRCSPRAAPVRCLTATIQPPAGATAPARLPAARAPPSEEALTNGGDGPAVARAAESAAERTRSPRDLSGSPEYRAHLARVLTRRAVLAPAGMG